MKFFAFLFFLAIAPMAIAGPRTINNGGGGIVRDGVYMTFGSAGVVIDPEPMKLKDLPSITLLKGTIDGLLMAKYYKVALGHLIMPFGARKYFRVVKEKFDAEAYRRLQEEYAKLALQSPDSITIFAITNPETRETFLLPEFFNLKPSEQTAIMFHEMYWIEKPDASYGEVVAAEIAFQDYFESMTERNEYKPALADKLSILVNNPNLALNMHLSHDIIHNAFWDINEPHPNGLLDINKLLAPNAFRCNDTTSWAFKNMSYKKDVVGEPDQLQHLYYLMEKYDRSFFLPALVNFMAPDAMGRTGDLRVGLFAGEAEKVGWECGDFIRGNPIYFNQIFFVSHDWGHRSVYLDREWKKSDY